MGQNESTNLMAEYSGALEQRSEERDGIGMRDGATSQDPERVLDAPPELVGVDDLDQRADVADGERHALLARGTGDVGRVVHHVRAVEAGLAVGAHRFVHVHLPTRRQLCRS